MARMKNKDELTPRQEIFAQEIANGLTGADAYRVAYGQGNMTDEALYVSASRLRNSTKVDLRVKAILAERAQNSGPDRERCNAVLMNIVNASPKHTMYTDPKTGKMKMRSPSQLADSTADAISDMSNNQGRVHYKFHGKVEAIRLLAQINGWDAPKEVNVNTVGGMVGELRIGFDDDDFEDD